jgi:outer membrane protein assembly factor BamE (lipoprotein component of BamABCDE complex)
MIKLSVAAFSIAVLLTPSCFMTRSTVNEPLIADKLASLKPGATAAQVAETLGAPTEVIQLDKRMAWRYDFTQSKTAGIYLIVVNFQNVDLRADRAWIFFDANNTLLYASNTFQAANSEYAMPWSDVHGQPKD